MSCKILHPGGEIPLTFSLTDDEGQPQEYESLLDCIVEMTIDGYVVDKFSKEEADGYQEIIPSADVPSEFICTLKASNTINYLQGSMNVTVSKKVDDPDYQDGKTQIQTFQNVLLVKKYKF